MNLKVNPYELANSQSFSEVQIYGQNQGSSSKKGIQDLQNITLMNISNRAFAPSANLLRSTKNEAGDKEKKAKHTNQKNILNNGVMLFKKQIEEVNSSTAQQGNQNNANRGRNLLTQKEKLPQFSKKFLSQSIDQEYTPASSAMGGQIRRIYQKNRCISQLSQYEFDTTNRMALGASIDRSNIKQFQQFQQQQQTFKNELFITSKGTTMIANGFLQNGGNQKNQSPKYQQGNQLMKGLMLQKSDDYFGEENNILGDISVDIPSKYQQHTTKSNNTSLFNGNSTKNRFLLQHNNQTPSVLNKQLTKLTEQDSSQFTLVSIDQVQNSNQKMNADGQNSLKFSAPNPFNQKTATRVGRRYDAGNDSYSVKSTTSQYAKSKSPSTFQKDSSFSQTKNIKAAEFSQIKNNENNTVIVINSNSNNNNNSNKQEIQKIDDGIHSLKQHIYNPTLDLSKQNNGETNVYRNKKVVYNSIDASSDSKNLGTQFDFSESNKKLLVNNQNRNSVSMSSNKSRILQQKENTIQEQQSTIILSQTDHTKRQKMDVQQYNSDQQQIFMKKLRQCLNKFKTSYQEIQKSKNTNLKSYQEEQKSLINGLQQRQDLGSEKDKCLTLNEYLENEEMKQASSQSRIQRPYQLKGNAKFYQTGLNMIHRLFIKKYGSILLTELKIQKRIADVALKSQAQ